MVRPGITLYGLHPSMDVKNELPLQEAITLKSKVSFVKTLQEGHYISYGNTYRTTKEERIATIPIGYADGYPRALSNLGEVLINGVKCPIVGRVCMDQLMVDVSHIDGVTEGVEVVLYGVQGEEAIYLKDVVHKTPYLPYELLCMMSKRIPRFYYSGGKLIDMECAL